MPTSEMTTSLCERQRGVQTGRRNLGSSCPPVNSANAGDAASQLFEVDRDGAELLGGALESTKRGGLIARGGRDLLGTIAIAPRDLRDPPHTVAELGELQ